MRVNVVHDLAGNNFYSEESFHGFFALSVRDWCHRCLPTIESTHHLIRF